MGFFLRIGRFYLYNSPLNHWKFKVRLDKDTSKWAHKTHCAIIEVKDDQP